MTIYCANEALIRTDTDGFINVCFKRVVEILDIIHASPFILHEKILAIMLCSRLKLVVIYIIPITYGTCLLECIR